MTPEETAAAAAMAALHAAFAAEKSGDGDGALSHAIAAMTSFDAAGDPMGGSAARQFAAVITPDPFEADQWLEQAMALRKASGDIEGLISAAADRFDRALEAGDVKGALAHANGWVEAIADRHQRASVAQRIAARFLDEGLSDAASYWVSDALFALDPLSDAAPRAALTLAAARIAYVGGDAAGAKAGIAEATRLARLGGARAVEIDASHLDAQLRIAEGDLKGARRLLLGVLDGRVVLGDEAGKASARHDLARVALALGDADGAIDELRIAAAASERAGDAASAIGAWFQLAGLLEQRESWAEAVAAGDRLVGALGASPAADRADAVHDQGLRRLRLGDLEGAAKDLAMAVALRAPDDTQDESRGAALAMLGQVLRRLGRLAPAQAAFDDAVRALAPIAPDAAAAVRALRDEA